MDRADCQNAEPSPFGLVVKLELLRRRNVARDLRLDEFSG